AAVGCGFFGAAGVWLRAGAAHATASAAQDRRENAEDRRVMGLPVTCVYDRIRSITRETGQSVAKSDEIQTYFA
ncbi:MAG TPA: hypothetical protein VF402_10575, partial [Asticcacaulis sp.]